MQRRGFLGLLAAAFVGMGFRTKRENKRGKILVTECLHCEGVIYNRLFLRDSAGAYPAIYTTPDAHTSFSPEPQDIWFHAVNESSLCLTDEIHYRNVSNGYPGYVVVLRASAATACPKTNVEFEQWSKERLVEYKKRVNPGYLSRWNLDFEKEREIAKLGVPENWRVFDVA